MFFDCTFNEVGTESCKSIFVRDDNLRDASCFDEVQKGEKTFPLEVEA